MVRNLSGVWHTLQPSISYEEGIDSDEPAPEPVDAMSKPLIDDAPMEPETVLDESKTETDNLGEMVEPVVEEEEAVTASGTMDATGEAAAKEAERLVAPSSAEDTDDKLQRKLSEATDSEEE